MKDSPYLPRLARIEEIRVETEGRRAIKTFRVSLKDGGRFTFAPGQCVMVSVMGVGEAIFAVSSPPNSDGYIEFSVMKLGRVTSALHRAEVGETLGIRGPYGRPFPVEEWKGRNLLIIGGGIGAAPLRSLIGYVLNHREEYGSLTVLYGARSSRDLCYREEMRAWAEREDITLHLTIDRPEEGWEGLVGMVPDVLREIRPRPENTVAVTCGPPIMIKFVMEALAEMGFPPEDIYTTLERRMKCGIGKCGRCNIGHLYVCKDGPVFSYAEILGVSQSAGGGDAL